MTVVPELAPRAPSTGSARCCCRCRTATPRCARCSISKACTSGSRGQARGLPAAGAMPSTASGSTTTKARSPRMRIDLDDLGLDRGAPHSRRPRARRDPGGFGPGGRRARPAPRAPPRHVVSRTWSRVPGPRRERRNRGAGPAGSARRRAVGPSRRAPEARRRTGLMRGHPPSGGSRRAVRWWSPVARCRTSPSTSATTCGPTSCPGCTRRPRRRSGIRRPRCDWDAPVEHPDDVEDAVVQVMTYLVENEQVALVVPARFLGAVHPHFREVVQLLAVQVADEARHVEVFSRRAGLAPRRARGRRPWAGGRRWPTLLDEPDFTIVALAAVGAGRGHVPEPAVVPRAITGPIR